jgi:hypothetical protein
MGTSVVVGSSRIRTFAIASILSGAPSTLWALHESGSPKQAVRSGLDATRAIGVLLPPGRPGVLRGALAHAAISVVMGELLLRALPNGDLLNGRLTRRLGAGALAGLAMGAVNVGLIGRQFDEIRALPLGPQLADNVAFGVVIAALSRATRSTVQTQADDHGPYRG